MEDADVLLTEHEITHIVAADPSEVSPKNVGGRPLHTKLPPSHARQTHFEQNSAENEGVALVVNESGEIA